MLCYRKHQLANGLTVLLHEAWDTPLATVNLLYNVGSRDEEPHLTGFAHLFEHLMFGGTPDVPDLDTVVSNLGGENNAFTGNDFTNYYITLPAEELDTALFLEADRMAHLDISQHALEVQQSVVTEEYNQRYKNTPYGDMWLLMRPLCYKAYPYRWCPIGADIRHVSEASLDDVRAFHRKHYQPSEAILSIAAPLESEAMLEAVERAWHSKRVETPHYRNYQQHPYPTEPQQEMRRTLHVQRDVPATHVYIAYPMGDHFGPHFRACDLLSDLLASGTSSRLHRKLVLEEGLLTEADACITADAGPGLLLLSGNLNEGVDAEQAVEALRREAMQLTTTEVSDYELQKVVNRYENNYVLSQYKAADRALALCQYTWLGDTDMLNHEVEHYRQLTPHDLLVAAQEVLRPEHENILYYERKESDK